VCYCDECYFLSVIMPSVPIVIALSVVMLNAIMLSVIVLSAVMLSVN